MNIACRQFRSRYWMPCVLAMTLATAQAQTAHLSVGDYTEEVGQEVEIELHLDCDVDLWHVNVAIAFEANLLDYVQGSLQWDARVVAAKSTYSSTSGLFRAICGGEPLADWHTLVVTRGSGRLCRFRLRCQAGGLSALTLTVDDARPVGSPFNLSRTKTNGQVVIAGPGPLTFTPPAGTYGACQDVALASPGATAIHYTLDGSEPDDQSPLYVDGLPVELCGADGQTVPLKAVAFDAGGRWVRGQADYRFDFTAPTVTINQAATQADPTKDSPIRFTAIFSEPVFGFVAADVDTTVTGTLAVTGVDSAPAAPNNGTTWTISMSVTGEGTLTATIPAGICTDAVGNPNAASTSTDNQVTRDTTPPAAPAFLPPHHVDGTYAVAQTVWVTVPDDAAWVRYTLDDTTPTIASPLYDAGLGLAVDGEHGEVVWVRLAAWDAAGNRSAVVAGRYFTFDKQGPQDYTAAFEAVAGYLNAAMVAKAAIVIHSTPEQPAATYAFVISDGLLEVVGAGTVTLPELRLAGLDLSHLADGPLNLEVRLQDWLGNPGELATDQVVKDTIPPAAPTELTVSNPVTAANVAAVALAGEGEAGATLLYAFRDGGQRGEVGGTLPVDGDGRFASILDLTALADGPLHLSLQVRDPAGNLGPAVEVELFKDTLPPNLAFLAPPAGAYVNGQAVVSFDNDDPHAPQLSFDGSNWSAAASGATRLADIAGYDELADGPITLFLRDIDAVGNLGMAGPLALMLDTLPPVAALIGCPDGPTSANAIHLTVAGQQVVFYDYDFNGQGYTGTPIPVDLPIALAALPDGPHTVRVIGVDAAGNWQDDPQATVCAWVVDTVPPSNPTLNDATPTIGARTREDQVQLFWTPAADPGGSGVHGSSLLVSKQADQLPDDSLDPLPNTISLNQGEGDYYLHVRTVDRAGNWAATQHYGPWTLDLTPPTAVLANLPPRYTFLTSISVTVGGDDVVRYRHQLNGLGWSEDRFPFQPIELAGLPAGDYLLEVVARDTAGNWQTAANATRHAWTVEFTIPTNPQIATPVAGLFTNQPNHGLAWTAVDDDFNVGYAIVVDRNPQTNPDPQVTDDQLPDTLSLNAGEGEYWLHIRTLGRNGRWSPVTHAGPWTLDQTPPAAPSIQAPPPGIVKPPLHVLLELPADAAVARYTLDGSLPDLASPIYSPPGIPVAGEHGQVVTVTARCYDAAGNVSASVAGAYTLDALAPDGYAIVFQAGLYVNAATVAEVWLLISGAEIDATYRCTVAEAGGAGEQTRQGVAVATDFPLGPFDLSALADGELTATLALTDPPGNVGEPAVALATKDTIPPAAPAELQATNPVNQATVAAVELAGKGEPGAVAEFAFRDTAGRGAVLGTLPVDGDGHFAGQLDLGELADGPIELSVQVRDPAGNLGPPATLELLKDTLPPTLIFVAPNPGQPVNGQAAVFFDNDDPHAPQLSFDGANWSPAESGLTTLADLAGFPALADGPITLFLRDTDAAGNLGQAAPLALVLDTLPPPPPTIGWIDQDTGLPGDFVTGDNAFAVGGDAEPGAQVRLLVDDLQVATATADNQGQWQLPAWAPPLPDGAYRLAAEAVDLAGNLGPRSPETLVVVDTQPPLAEFLPTGPAPVNAAPVVFVLLANEPLTGLDNRHFAVQNGTLLELVADPDHRQFEILVEPLADGLVCLEFRDGTAADLAGNPLQLDEPLACLDFLAPWTLAGTAIYDGVVAGPTLFLAGYADSTLAGTPQFQVAVPPTAGRADPQAFDVVVATPGSHYLVLYLDLDDNGQLDTATEPYGLYDGNPLALIPNTDKRVELGDIAIFDWRLEVVLQPGWNALAWPGRPAPADLEALFVAAQIDSAYAWTGGAYWRLEGAIPQTAVLVHVASPPALPMAVRGFYPAAPPDLPTGWNLVGVRHPQTLDWQNGGATPASFVPVGWRQQGDNFLPLRFGDTLLPGIAYWLLVDSPGSFPW